MDNERGKDYWDYHNYEDVFKEEKEMLNKTIKNPIYVEYYSHEECHCYKIDLPFTTYKAHTIVLCPVSEGLNKATYLATKKLTEHILDSLRNPLEKEKTHD